ADRGIVINTCSKTFPMTGWRSGYVAPRNALAQGPAMIQRTTPQTVNTMAQRAAVTALTSRPHCHARRRTEPTSRRDLLCRLVIQMPGLQCEKPEAAFYVFVRVDAPLSSAALTDHCMSHGVAVRSGTEFGARGEGFIRLTFSGTPAEFEPGLQRLG